MTAFKTGELVRVTGRLRRGRIYHFFYVGQVVRVIGETHLGSIKCTDGDLEQNISPEDLEKIET